MPHRYTGDNSMENLRALCRSCHMRTRDHGRRGSPVFLRYTGPRRPTKREIGSLRQRLRAAAATARRREAQIRAEEMSIGGASLREIARALGVSHQTVANWLQGRYGAGVAGEPTT